MAKAPLQCESKQVVFLEVLGHTLHDLDFRVGDLRFAEQGASVLERLIPLTMSRGGSRKLRTNGASFLGRGALRNAVFERLEQSTPVLRLRVELHEGAVR